MPYTHLAKVLVDHLKLTHVPIGMAFLKEPPSGVPRYKEAVPSACAFWKAAESSLFYATAEDHYNCPIGAITQGFRIPQEVLQNAVSLIDRMGKLAYIEAAEAQNVPSVEKDHEIIVYGPLKGFAGIEPDLALFILTPFQAMLISEATGAVAWGGAPQPRALGRPSCAVIPSAMKNAATTVSMACMGARTFAGIEEKELILAIPAPSLLQLEQKLPTILAANSGMGDFYAEHKSRYTQL